MSIRMPAPPRATGARLSLRVLALPIAAMVFAGLVLPTEAAAAATDPPANDAITNATVITSLPYTASQDSINATTNTGGIPDPTPNCHPELNGYTVWYRYTPRKDATVRIQVTGGDMFPPIVSVYKRHGTTLTAVDCISESNGKPIELNAHTNYYLMLASYSERPTFTITVTRELAAA